jgi:NIMA-interacting peptidyl-prolyl cis-trans isomerase 1
MTMRRSLHKLIVPALALAASLGGCQCLTAPPPSRHSEDEGAPAATAPPASSAAPAQSSEVEAARPIVGASQILVAYKGAELAPANLTRSKKQAKHRAEEVLAKLGHKGASFEVLAKQYSDDPTKAVGGAMGNFEQYAMPAAFADAAFALEIGQTSRVVETPRGFHIIRRTR